MKLIRSISSVLLALLVLLASSSFYVGVHVCGGTVKAVAFLQEADGCGHQALPPCHRQQMKGCCENDLVVHDAQEIKGEIAKVTLPLVSSTDIIHNTVLIADIIPIVELNSSTYFIDHPPGRVDRDIVISIHSLLI